MKYLIAVVLAFFAQTAFADINDSGNLSIGGNAVIAGTQTIQGNAFSVGGSTFSISGGSGTLAYRFSPGSISMTGSTGTFLSASSVTASAFFGDGSHLSGITTLGPLNVTAASTASVVVANTVSGSTIALGTASCCSGFDCIVASTTPAEGTRQFGFAGLSASSSVYLLEGFFSAGNAASYYDLIFNGDTNSRYSYGHQYETINGGASNQGSGVNQGASCQFPYLNIQIFANQMVTWRMYIFLRGTYAVVETHMITSNDGTSSTAYYRGHCHYRGAAAVTSMTFAVRAGGPLFTGDFWLKRVR